MPGVTIPSRFNIARHCLAGNVRVRPDKTALIMVGDGFRDRRFTFSGIDDQVRRVAGGFRRLGLAPGARIMIRWGNDIDYAIVFLGAVAAGCVPLPSSSQLTPGEAEFLLADSGASAVVVAQDLVAGFRAPAGVRVIDDEELQRLKASVPLSGYADTRAEDPAYLIYTSGTGGRPKGVLHAHRSLLGRQPMYRGWLGLGEDDLVLHAGALNWTYTLGVGLLDPWVNGAGCVLYNGPRDVQVWPALIERYRATIFAAVPSLYRQILKYCPLDRAALCSLRHGVTAGEALPPKLLQDWRATTGRDLFEALGMSEISTYISSGPDTPVRPGSPGRPQPGRRVVVLPLDAGSEPLPAGEVGLLAVHRSDPGLMLGYWNRPDEDSLVYRNDWFLGGDLASVDADGYVWYHGRNDDVMNALGYRVSPLEVELALSAHPGVAEVAVAEREVRDGVRVIAAYVVPRDPEAADAGEILASAAERLAAYKRPREVIFVDHLPRTPNGKVRRRDLARLGAVQA